MTDRDLLLLVADAAGGSVDGRTILQKLAYFVGRRLERDLGHNAHFYGPFSSKIENSLKVSVIAGELNETAETLPNWYGGPDALKYSYELTPQGSARVHQLRGETTAAALAVDETVNAIREVIPEFRQRALSAAAKIDLILSEHEGPVPVAELRDLAGALGWTLSDDEVQQSVQVLEQLKLVTTTTGH